VPSLLDLESRVKRLEARLERAEARLGLAHPERRQCAAGDCLDWFDGTFATGRKYCSDRCRFRSKSQRRRKDPERKAKDALASKLRRQREPRGVRAIGG
jgi:hypothetical protein